MISFFEALTLIFLMLPMALGYIGLFAITLLSLIGGGIFIYFNFNKPILNDFPEVRTSHESQKEMPSFKLLPNTGFRSTQDRKLERIENRTRKGLWINEHKEMG